MTNEKREDAGFLRNLLNDTAGNVLMLTAAATIPMLGVIGGAVDISRLYLVKSRVQAACDSAVLAGRKAMSTNTYTTAAQTRANNMFNFNFQNADYGTTGTSFVSSANAQGVVSGTATTTVPMVLMNIVGVTPTTLSVTCSADIQIPNIDIVFVLDVTGSMNDCPDGSCNGSPSGEVRKIESLKSATKDFYTTLANAMVGNTTSRVRYGFVPYSQAVNGKDLFKASPDATLGEAPLSHLVNAMEVQSRVANFNTYVDELQADELNRYEQAYEDDDPDTKQPWQQDRNDHTDISNLDCGWYGANQSFTIGSAPNVYLWPRTDWPGAEGVGDSELYQKNGAGAWTTSAPTLNNGEFYIKITFQRKTGAWTDGSMRECRREVIHTKYTRHVGYKFTNWTYKPVTYDVSNFKASSAINYVSSIDTNYTLPAGGSFDPVTMRGWASLPGSTSSTTWDGCIEERTTTPAATFQPIPTLAYDLNVLDGGTTDTMRWRPILRELTYDRGQAANEDNASSLSKPDYTCPTARMRNLKVWTQTDFNTYVDGLSPGGYTYLDVGMVWGLRLISSQGMFASRNLTGPNGGQISRHIIFLTDGEPVSRLDSYSAYGVEGMAQRIAGGSTSPDAATRHARRFQALCDLQRGGVSIWAIALGTSVTGNMSTCADPGRAFEADNTTELRDAFRSIAQDIADLRLVQ